jgi:hypothetical protein
MPYGIERERPTNKIQHKISVMKNLVRFSFIQFVFLILVSTAFAQNPVPTPPLDDTSKTFEVRLPVTVTDKKKNLVFCSESKKRSTSEKKKEIVQCFSKDDFVVLEDGVPQEVTFFTSEKTNPPVYVGVLMDTSPSTA